MKATPTVQGESRHWLQRANGTLSRQAMSYLLSFDFVQASQLRRNWLVSSIKTTFPHKVVRKGLLTIGSMTKRLQYQFQGLPQDMLPAATPVPGTGVAKGITVALSIGRHRSSINFSTSRGGSTVEGVGSKPLSSP